jgi:phosphate transport system substrate-binding protein
LVKLYRYGRLAAVGVAGALALTACGSDDNTTKAGSTPSGSSSGSAGASITCAKGTLSGEGSSAQKNAMEELVKAYQAKCEGTTINYNATGQVDFAGSDSALKKDKGEVAAAAKRCQGNTALNLPLVVGPVAIAYNAPGLDGLVLNGEVAAKIFNGTVKKWNDPAIAALNKDAKLPEGDIKVFARSDESGTTENFEKYLKAASNGAWTKEPSKQWAGTGEGREKSSGVQEAVKAEEGSIGYMEWSFARDAQLGIAKIDSGSGPVELTGETAGKALEAAKNDGEGNDLRLKLDYGTKEAGVYPIVLVTYEIVCEKGLAADKAALVKSFLGYAASDEAQKKIQEIGYAPLPPSVREKVTSAVASLG